jgi:hypothetical protein
MDRRSLQTPRTSRGLVEPGWSAARKSVRLPKWLLAALLYVMVFELLILTQLLLRREGTSADVANSAKETSTVQTPTSVPVALASTSTPIGEPRPAATSLPAATSMPAATPTAPPPTPTISPTPEPSPTERPLNVAQAQNPAPPRAALPPAEQPPAPAPPAAKSVVAESPASGLGPEGAIRRHYELINERRYDEGYTLMSSSLQALNSRDEYRAWFAGKLGIVVESVGLVSQEGGLAIVDSVVLSTDRIGQQVAQQRVSERFTLVLEGGSWRIARVTRL